MSNSSSLHSRLDAESRLRDAEQNMDLDAALVKLEEESQRSVHQFVWCHEFDISLN